MSDSGKIFKLREEHIKDIKDTYDSKIEDLKEELGLDLFEDKAKLYDNKKYQIYRYIQQRAEQLLQHYIDKREKEDRLL
ncbi:MAG: hypothetical protein EOL97_15530 [Spirochaetia bacterium]|nr:hypothetical protein [Spirochaetia bacterium]